MQLHICILYSKNDRMRETLEVTYLNRYYLNLKILIVQSGMFDIKERGNIRRSIYI